MTAVETILRRALAPPDDLPVHEWASRNVYLDARTTSMPGYFNPDTCPWVIEPLAMMRDNGVESVACMTANQVLKTTTSLLYLLWLMKNEPGPAMWVLQSMDEAKFFARERMWPILDQCKTLTDLLPDHRHRRNTYDISFASMPFVMGWGGSTAKFQQKSLRYLFLDECELYGEMVTDAEKRTTAYWNSRTIYMSTPTMEDGVIHRKYLEGDQRRWFWPCAECGAMQTLEWKQLKWDMTEQDGRAVWEKVAPTIRYECEVCHHKHEDKPASRWHIVGKGEWRPTNPNAIKIPRRKISYHWNALISPIISWLTLIQEWHAAQQLRKNGVLVELQNFINKRLGEPWESRFEADEKELFTGNYMVGDAVESARDFRFLTVDVQSRSFWAVARDWFKDSSSRLVWEGELLTWGDVLELQQRLGIKNPRWVFLDGRYDTQNVYTHATQFSWTVLMGEDRPSFGHQIKGGKRVQRLYSEPFQGDPGIGTSKAQRKFAVVFRFASPTAKDILARLRSGRGPKWELPANLSDTYRRQINAEAKMERRNKQTGQIKWEWVRLYRQNHLWDCETMQVVAAAMAGLVWTQEDETIIGKD